MKLEEFYPGDFLSVQGSVDSHADTRLSSLETCVPGEAGYGEDWFLPQADEWQNCDAKYVHLPVLLYLLVF